MDAPNDFSKAIQDLAGSEADPAALRAELAALVAKIEEAPNLEYLERIGQLKKQLGIRDNTMGTVGPASTEPVLPQIVSHQRQLRDKVREAWAAVHLYNDAQAQPRVFWRGRALARLSPEADDSVCIDLMNRDAVMGLLTRSADWFTLDRRGEKQPANPDELVAKDMQSSPDPKLPPLEALVDSPVVGRSGRIIDVRGYHPEDKLWLHLPPGTVMPKVPSQPSVEDVALAKRLLFDDLLVDFAWASPADRANALAMLLLPVVRRLIPDVTPLHFISAPKPRTGKDLLADLVSIVPTGRRIQTTTLARDDDEMRKHILSLLMGGQSTVLFSNVPEKEPLDSAVLAGVLTAERFQGRILGLSQQVTCSTLGVVWLATGNNPRPSEELAGRIVRIHLDRGVATPATFSPPNGWRHGDTDLRVWAKEHRFEILHALLTLAQAWLVAGRPAYSGLRPASYGEWAKVVGGILEHAGVEGFLGNYEQWLGTTSTGAEGAFVKTWWERFKGGEVTGQQLAELALEKGLVRGATPQAKNASLGKLLRSWLGAQKEGFVIQGREDRHLNAWRWRLSQVSQPQPSADVEKAIWGEP